MYNRYIRNDQGAYTRVPEEDVPPRPAPDRSSPSPPPSGGMEHGTLESPGTDSRDRTPGNSPPPPGSGLFGGFPPVGSGDLRKLLDRFHLDRVDSGDLLLLGLLFLLYREGADEELLFALGLLLIL